MTLESPNSNELITIKNKTMNQELTTTGILSLFETSKEQRQTFVNDLVNRIETGTVDPVKIHLQIKSMEEIVKSITSNDRYKDLLLDESNKYGKSFEKYNGKFSIKEVGVKYDYSKCGDLELDELQKNQDELSDKIKKRQEFLKTIPTSGIDIITADGECIKVFPPAKSSTTSVTVTLK